jgi:uncharacterized protein HemY
MPDDPFLLHILGRVHMQRQEFELAAEVLRQVDTIAPGQE